MEDLAIITCDTAFSFVDKKLKQMVYRGSDCTLHDIDNSSILYELCYNERTLRNFFLGLLCEVKWSTDVLRAERAIFTLADGEDKFRCAFSLYDKLFHGKRRKTIATALWGYATKAIEDYEER